MRTIVVTIPVEDRHKAYLEQIGKDCEFVYTSPKEVTEEQAASADIIIGNVPPAKMHAPEKLQWMQLNSAGADNYCKPGILKDETVLTNATGAYGLAISEYMLGQALNLQKKFYEYQENQKNHEWKDLGKVGSIYGSVTVILGLGDIGGEFAKRMKAMGSYTIGVRRTAGEKPDYLDEIHTTDELDSLLPRADFLAMSLPNTPQTFHIMTEERLRMMKKTAFLINVGRGTAIDQEALIRVLKDGHLGGCAVDVVEGGEPMAAENPLWEAPRVLITPHVAGGYHVQETFERIVRISGENLEKFLAGDIEHMRSKVNRATGYRAR